MSITSNSEDTATEKAKSKNPFEDFDFARVDTLLKRLYFIGSIFYLYFLYDSYSQYTEYKSIAILGDALGIFIGFFLLLVSRRIFIKGNKIAAINILPWVILFSYGWGDLFLLGVTGYNLITGILLLLIIGFMIRPPNFKYWIQFGLFYIITVLIFSQIQIIPKFDVNLSPSWATSLPLLSGLLGVTFTWQFVFLLRNVRLRTRLLVTFIVIAIVPTLIVTITSTVTSYQSGEIELVNELNLFSVLQEVKINSWLLEQQIEIDEILNNIEGDTFLVSVLTGANNEITNSIGYDYINTKMEEFNGSSSFIKNIGIVDFNATRADGTSENLSNLDYYFSNLFSQYPLGYFYPPPVKDGNELIFYMNVPIREVNQTIGFLIIEYDQSGLIRLLELSNNNSDGIKVSMFTEDFLPLIYSDIEIELPFQNTGNPHTPPDIFSLEANRSSLLESFPPKESASAIYSDETGSAAIGFQIWIPKLSLNLISETSRGSAFSNIQGNILINIAVALIAVIISVGISLVITNSISQPIAELAEQARAISSGTLSPVIPNTRNDEIGELNESFSVMTNQLKNSVRNLEGLVADRTEELNKRATYLEAAAEIGRAATEIDNQQKLMSRSTQLISEKFGFYHVGIFVNDEQGEFTLLSASNSEGGLQMLANGHKLRIGEQGIVGFVTGSGTAKIQQAVDDDTVHYKNPYLPETKSEMALPLTVKNVLLGALDIQSKKTDAFAEDDIEILQVLADQVAIALNNNLLISQMQERIEVEKRIYGDISKQGWLSLIQQGDRNLGYTHDQAGLNKTNIGLTPLSKNTISQGESKTIPPNDKGYPLSIPIFVREGLPIAAIETYKSIDNGPWTSNEIEVLENIGNQIGVALENARLYEETQKLAQREKISSEVSSKIWAKTNIDEIIKTGLEEIGKALNVSQGTIELKLSDTQKVIE